MWQSPWKHVRRKRSAWHRVLKCAAGQITMEKTPVYFGESTIVPSLVHQMNSSIRLLVALRDPVERAISHYLEVLSRVIHTVHLGWLDVPATSSMLLAACFENTSSLFCLFSCLANWVTSSNCHTNSRTVLIVHFFFGLSTPCFRKSTHSYYWL